MRKKNLLILIFSLCALIMVPTSCSRKYYSDHPGKVTKGYKKPPKAWKQPRSRYVEETRR